MLRVAFESAKRVRMESKFDVKRQKSDDETAILEVDVEEGGKETPTSEAERAKTSLIYRINGCVSIDRH